MNKTSLVLIISGVLLAVLSHPRAARPITLRLMNEGILTPKVPKHPEKTEILKFGGPNLSLLFAGLILILTGIILTAYES